MLILHQNSFSDLYAYIFAFFQPVFIVPGQGISIHLSLPSVQYLVFIIPSLLKEFGFQSGTIYNTRFEIEFEKAPGTLLIRKEQFCNWIILFNALVR